jgi:high-affinity Fe2+/Pb2+ permease
MLFPAILAVVTTSKILSEYRQYGYSEVLFWFNVLIYIFIMISIGFYLYGIHFKPKKHITMGYKGRSASLRAPEPKRYPIKKN